MKDNSTCFEEEKKINEICGEVFEIYPHSKKSADEIYARVSLAIRYSINLEEALSSKFIYKFGRLKISVLSAHGAVREKGHSIKTDRRSDKTTCILHGRRADNGDSWKESFSLEDAQRLNIIPAEPKGRCMEDILFDCAITNLCEHLFPDVVMGLEIDRDYQTFGVPFGCNEDALLEEFERENELEELLAF